MWLFLCSRSMISSVAWCGKNFPEFLINSVLFWTLSHEEGSWLVSIERLEFDCFTNFSNLRIDKKVIHSTNSWIFKSWSSSSLFKSNVSCNNCKEKKKFCLVPKFKVSAKTFLTRLKLLFSHKMTSETYNSDKKWWIKD